MTRLIDRIVAWLDRASESPRLTVAGFHFCQEQSRWMLGDRVFATRHAAMEHLRDLTIERALRKMVSR
jgi:hypothetical protein